MSDATTTSNAPAAPKAPDAFICPQCRTNQAVYVDRQRNFRSGISSAFVSYFFCQKCDKKFWRMGPAIIVPNVYVGGFLFLVLLKVMRI